MEAGIPPSLGNAAELRAAFEEQQRAIAVLLAQNPTVADLQEAARGVVLADARLEAAMSAVRIEVGALELPILRDQRPRTAADLAGLEVPTDE